MIEVLFRNMDASESLRTYLTDQMRGIIFSHPRPALLRTRASVEAHKPPYQTGKDHFTVKIVSGSNMAEPIVVEKTANLLHDAVQAALQTFSVMVERVNHRHRVHDRHRAREIKEESLSKIPPILGTEENDIDRSNPA
jgi:ribosome-associated translation inhibitor RaiA